jgi:hypothetical protein
MNKPTRKLPYKPRTVSSSQVMRCANLDIDRFPYERLTKSTRAIVAQLTLSERSARVVPATRARIF